MSKTVLKILQELWILQKTYPPQLQVEIRKKVLSTLPEVILFYHTGKGIYLGKFV